MSSKCLATINDSSVPIPGIQSEFSQTAEKRRQITKDYNMLKTAMSDERSIEKRSTSIEIRVKQLHFTQIGRSKSPIWTELLTNASSNVS